MNWRGPDWKIVFGGLFALSFYAAVCVIALHYVIKYW
jgi:hypothetical protein